MEKEYVEPSDEELGISFDISENQCESRECTTEEYYADIGGYESVSVFLNEVKAWLVNGEDIGGGYYVYEEYMDELKSRKLVVTHQSKKNKTTVYDLENQYISVHIEHTEGVNKNFLFDIEKKN